MYAQAPPPQGAPVYQTYDPNAPQQQYAQYPPQQGTVVVQTQTGYVPPPPQQVVVVFVAGSFISFFGRAN
jgi:hypothetical protein